MGGKCGNMLCRNWLQPVLRAAGRRRRAGLGGGEAATVAAGLDIHPSVPAARLLPGAPEPRSPGAPAHFAVSQRKPDSLHSWLTVAKPA